LSRSPARHGRPSERRPPDHQAAEAVGLDDQRLGAFLRVLGHELRNPLAPIRSALAVWDRSDPGSEQASRARTIIGRQAEQLTRLVDDLLDLSRLSSGRVELQRAALDLGEVVAHAGEDLSPLMAERGLALSIEVPCGAVWIDGDAARLTQVIGNLLHNSMQQTGPGGRVALSLAAAGGHAEITVRDTGAGLERDDLLRLSEPLAPGRAGTSGAADGLGLGLRLVKQLIGLHGGTVEAHCAGRGLGAEFRVLLPLAPTPVSRLEPDRAEVGPARRRRVLVVDDNHDGAETLAQIIELFGHDVEVAHDVPEALLGSLASPPDVVISDVGMPGMSGCDLARILRANRAFDATWLVALSGHSRPSDRAEALAAGFDEHRAKPIEAGALERLLAGPLERRAGQGGGDGEPDPGRRSLA
jgi:CheY-like chemotaxis protein